MENIRSRICRCGVIPAAVIESEDIAVPVAEAMLAGGIDALEITFRTPAAADAIRAVSENCPDMLVGAGTVLNTSQCALAIDSGARFVVAPGFDPEVVEICLERGVLPLPGCATSTEITAALKTGLTLLKFFPAESSGGIKTVKALAGPFAHTGLKLVPTGGITPDNLEGYLSNPFVAAVCGTWLCPGSALAAGNFGEITELCRQARMIADSARS